MIMYPMRLLAAAVAVAVVVSALALEHRQAWRQGRHDAGRGRADRQGHRCPGHRGGQAGDAAPLDARCRFGHSPAGRLAAHGRPRRQRGRGAAGQGHAPHAGPRHAGRTGHAAADSAAFGDDQDRRGRKGPRPTARASRHPGPGRGHRDLPRGPAGRAIGADRSGQAARVAGRLRGHDRRRTPSARWWPRSTAATCR